MRVLFSIIFHFLIALPLYSQEIKPFIQKKPTNSHFVINNYSYHSGQD